MTFTGIPLAALDFYEDLGADNSKTFWTAHKPVYDTAVRAPMVALAAELEAEFGAPKIFRPYRDVRFSADKTPYKTEQGVAVMTGPGSGYYVRINASGLYLGGGLYGGTSTQIANFRTAIDDAVRGAELEAILRDLRAAGFEIGGEKLKTRPKGYPADHARIDLLRHKALVAGLDLGCPPWLSTPEATTHVRDGWRTLRPLVEWVGAVVGTE